MTRTARPKGTIGMIVLCSLLVVVVGGLVLYNTGWTSWRWEESRGHFSGSACGYIGKSELLKLVPGGRFGGRIDDGPTGDRLVCRSEEHQFDSQGWSTLNVQIFRDLPTSVVRPAAERAESFGRSRCDRLTGDEFQRELGRLADPLCSRITHDSVETTVEIGAVNGPDVLLILYHRDPDAEVTAAENKAAVAQFAKQLLTKLAADSEE